MRTETNSGGCGGASAVAHGSLRFKIGDTVIERDSKGRGTIKGFHKKYTWVHAIVELRGGGTVDCNLSHLTIPLSKSDQDIVQEVFGVRLI